MYHGSRLTFYGGARARPCRGRGRARVEDEDETDRGRQTRDRVRYNNSLLVRVVVARHAASRVRRRRGVGAAHEKLAQESKRVRRSRRVELHHPVVQRARDGGFEVRLGRVRGARVVVLGRSRLVVRGVCRRFKRRFERNASVNRSVVRSHRVASRRARARARVVVVFSAPSFVFATSASVDIARPSPVAVWRSSPLPTSAHARARVSVTSRVVMTTRDDVSSGVSTPLPAREDSNDAVTTPNARDDDDDVLDLSVGSLDGDASLISPRDERGERGEDDDDAMNVAIATQRDARSRMNGRASSSSSSSAAAFSATATLRGAATKTMDMFGRVAVEAHGFGQSVVGGTVAMLERASIRTVPPRTPLDAERDETLADMSEVLDGSASPSTTSVDGRCHEYASDAVHVTAPAHATTMTTEEQMEAQGFRCRGCATNVDETPSWLSRAFRPFRHHQRCEYDGFVYCDACAPATSFAPIPWRILRDFDFRPRRVADRSRRFLASIDAAPIFNLGVIDPRLFKRFHIVAELRDARVRARAEIDALRRVSRAALDAVFADERTSPSTRELRVDGEFDPELFALDVLRETHKHGRLAVARVDRLAASCARARRRLAAAES